MAGPDNCSSARGRAGAKTRVRGIDFVWEGGTWGSTPASAGTHSASSCSCDGLVVDRSNQYDERLLGSLGLQGPYYNWNRWYLPSIGRYLELEPLNLGTVGVLYPPHKYGNFFAERYLELLEQPQRNAPYAYALNNPLSVIDTNGENGILVLGGVAAFCTVRPNVCQAAATAALMAVAATAGAIAGYCDAKAGSCGQCMCVNSTPWGNEGPYSNGRSGDFKDKDACDRSCKANGYSFGYCK